MFYANSAAADGRQSWCKACHSGYYRENASYAKHKKAYVAEYDFDNSEKVAARRAVKLALKEGRLEKGPCEVCGIEHGRIDAHHDDYTKQLDVRWLCRKHHLAHHRTLKLLAVARGLKMAAIARQGRQ